MITKAEIQFIRSLHKKEGRETSGKFLVEGEKIIFDLMHSGIKPNMLIATENWMVNNRGKLSGLKVEIRDCKNVDFQRCSTLKSPQEILAVFDMPERKTVKDISSGFILALDEIQDPGNLGTIIRTAAWYGIHYILCSEHCADVYNPKVIQSTMGGFSSVHVLYGNLQIMLQDLKKSGFSLAVAVMDGQSLNDFKMPEKLALIMGNESKGVSSEIQKLADMRIAINPYPIKSRRMESLNVSTATAILCHEIRKFK